MGRLHSVGVVEKAKGVTKRCTHLTQTKKEKPVPSHMRKFNFLLILFLWISTISAESGFYTTDPATGSIEFVHSLGASPNNVYQTHLAFPSSLTVDSYDETIYFANSPLSSAPWITSTEYSKDDENDLVIDSPPDFYPLSVISGIIYDADKLFTLFTGVPRNTYDTPLIAYVPLNSNDTSFVNIVDYTLTNQEAPNSFTLSPNNNVIYYTINNYVNSTKSGIFSVNYDTHAAGEVIQIEHNGTISSIQYSSFGLFYLAAYDYGTVVYRCDSDGASPPEVFLNSTSITPVQIFIAPNMDSKIWIRADDGQVSWCLTNGCATGPTVLVSLPYASKISDFVVDEGSGKIFFTGPSLQAIFAIHDDHPQDVVTTSTGVTTDTLIWVDSESTTVYFTCYNTINSYTQSDDDWDFIIAEDNVIELLVGDATLGDLIYTKSGANAIYKLQDGDDAATTLIDTPDTVTAMLFVGDTLFYAHSQTIYSCTYTSGCSNSKEFVTNIQSDVYSITIGTALTDMYYSTANGVYARELYGADSSHLIFASSRNVNPFAVAYAQQSDEIIFIDSYGESMILNRCNYSSCVPESIYEIDGSDSLGPGESAWIVIDESNSQVFWTASNLDGDIYVTNLNRTDNSTMLWKATGLYITGMALYQSDVLYVSHIDGVNSWTIEGTFSQSCNSTLEDAVLYGAISVTSGQIFMSEYLTGLIYSCAPNCGSCTEQDPTEQISSLACARLQFIQPYRDSLISQYNCGGLRQLSTGDDGAVTVVKTPDGIPISSLAVVDDELVWTLPYRASLMKGPIGSLDTDTETYYTGTGDFRSLFVDDSQPSAIYYWVNQEASKFMVYDSITVADYPNTYAGAFTFFNSNFEASSSQTATRTQSVSVSASVSPSASISSSASASRSVVASSSASASSSNSVQPSQSASQTPTSSSSSDSTKTASTSTSSSLSVTPSASMSATSSKSTGASPTSSSSVSPTASGTSSTSSSPSVTASTSGTASVTTSTSVSKSVVKTITATPSNTPGIPQIGNYTNSPLIGRTGWEWIGFLSVAFVILCVIPISFFCWKRGVESEMALSLRLPDTD